MRYSRGDIVEFKIGSNEKHTGQVRFVEEDYNENLLYVDSFCGWAYKVPEKRIISWISCKKSLHIFRTEMLCREFIEVRKAVVSNSTSIILTAAIGESHT